jgi:hypothetical protein
LMLSEVPVDVCSWRLLRTLRKLSSCHLMSFNCHSGDVIKIVVAAT